MSIKIRITVLIAAALVLAATPLGVVAQADQVEADDTLVLVQPRNAVTEDGAVLVTPVDGTYTFDVSAYETDGTPAAFTGGELWLFAQDAYSASCDPAVEAQGCAVLAAVPVVNDGDNAVTVSVSEAALNWRGVLPTDYDDRDPLMPGNGLVVSFGVADRGWDLGNYNPEANALAAQGNHEEAAQVDHVPSPLFLVTLQPAGLTTAGSPVLNGGMDLGAFAAGESLIMPGPGEVDTVFAGRQSAALGWIYSRSAFEAAPESTTALVPGKNGFALAVDYAATDNVDTGTYDQGVVLGQHFTLGDPSMNAPGAGWTFANEGTVTLTFDVWTDVPVEMGSTIHYVDDDAALAEVAVPARTTTTAGEWQTVAISYDVMAGAGPGARIELGSQLATLTINMNTGATTGTDARVLVDNVALTPNPLDVIGLQDMVLRSDLNDGYAMAVQPYGASTDDGLLAASQGLYSTPSGDYYLYEMTAYDYTRVGARTLPVGEWGNGDAGAVLQYRDLDNAEAGNPVARVDGGYEFVDADAVLVAVPADVDLSAADGPLVAVWGFTPLGAYQGAGCDAPCNQPAPGFYSSLKNSVTGLSIADQLDYLITPVELTGDAVGDFEFDLNLGVPTNTGGAFGVEVGSTAPVYETVDVVFYPGDGSGPYTEQVRVGRDDPATATFGGLGWGTPGDVLVVEDSTFSTGARIHLGGPIAAFDIGLPCAPMLDEGLCMPVSFTDLSVDTSADPDSGITEWVWDFGDGETETITDASNGDTTHRYVSGPGTYTVTLTVTDTDGQTHSTTDSITIGNALPVASLAVHDDGAPGIVAGEPVFFESNSFDNSIGETLAQLWTIAKDGTVLDTRTLARHQYTFPDNGTYDVSLTVTDVHGETSTDTTSVTVTNPAPVGTLNAPDGFEFLAGETVDVGARIVDASGVLSGSTTTLDVTGPNGFSAAGAVTDEFPTTNGWVRFMGLSMMPTDPGTYTVTLSGADDDGAPLTGQGGLTAAFTVVTNQAPTVTLDGPAEAVEIGDGATFVATATDPEQDVGTGHGVVAYEWDLGDGNTTTTSEPTLSYAYERAGTYTVSVVAIDDQGAASDAATATVVVDDMLLGSLEMPDGEQTSDDVWVLADPSALTSDARVLANVTYDNGETVTDGIGDATYVYRGTSDRPANVAGPTADVVVVNGEADIRLQPLASANAGSVQESVAFAPGLYDLTVVVTADSRAGGVAGPETIVLTTSFWIGPAPVDQPM